MPFKDIIKSISHLDNYLKRERPNQQYGDEQPLRSELFSIDQLAHHIKILAKEHEINLKHEPDGFLPRLDKNKKVLLQAYNVVMAAVEKEDRIAPAAEWLIDNFYLIEEQIRTARRHLPKGYSRELPRLLKGLLAGEPRIYAIALELISHSDGRLDAKSISSVVSAYQTVTTLKLGELWAFPIMLRLALIENLRRVAARITADRLDRNNAKLWTERLMEVVETDPKNLILVMADLAKSQQRLSSAFVAELVYRLQGQNPALAFPIAWIGQQLSGMGLTIELILQSESKNQATDRVSISNSIGSLRFLDALDWHEFVQTMSVVERTLRDDPADIYNKMDFATRDCYRHVIEEMARYSSLSEIEIARTAIELATESMRKEGRNNRSAHIGFYLIDRGLPQLKSAIKHKHWSIIGSIYKFGRRLPFLFYFGPIFFVTVIISIIVLTQGYAFRDINWVLILTGTILLICISQFAVSLVNWLATLWVSPQMLPKMDYSKGIPPESRTLVVVPTMLSNPQDIESLLDGLEVRYLANQDDKLHFGLLTDFCDAPNEIMPEDEQLVRLVQNGINKLNEKYKDNSSNIFFLLHRPRLWNAQEQIWMGYERKRGKIAELNSLLRRNDSQACFSLIVGDTSILPNIKYVITLDTDTYLPRDSARLLVETIVHPLNHPQYDKNKQLISDGYTIIQPRVEASMPATGRSLFTQLLSGESGIDPYTRAVSDIYQDVFHEGSFIGKGIYDVDAFMQVLHNRLPENLILSHDLIEGCYAHAALASDISLYEEYPDNYIADKKRRHRWIRGDWQIIRWLFSRIPGPGKERQKNPLSMLSQWKILDNIRRSLMPAALIILLILSWTVLTPAWLGALIVIGVIMSAPILFTLTELFKKPNELPINLHLRVAVHSILKYFIQPMLTIFFLPYEAFSSLDAIGTSIIRMVITHKRLLQWVTFSEQKQDGRIDLAGFCRSMWIAPAITLTIGLYLISNRPELLAIAMPFLLVWFISPVIAWWLSKPMIIRKPKLTDEQNIFLRKLSRKTWSYFEVFVGPENNWLSIDNYQEEPIEIAASRTSPTNIGLSLLANLAAYDFGYVSISQLIERTNQQLQAMEKLERFRGHFYNWYDTQSFKPLTPIYISTVDSGNLAGYLLTLKSGLLELPNNKIIPAPRTCFEGLADTLLVISDIVRKLDNPQERSGEFSAEVKKKNGMSPLTERDPKNLSSQGPEASIRLNRLQDELKKTPQTLSSVKTLLDSILKLITELIKTLDADPDDELKWWTNALKEQCWNLISDLAFWAPWLLISEPPESIWHNGSAEQVAQLGELRQMFRQLDNIPTLSEVTKLNSLLVPEIDHVINYFKNDNASVSDWLIKLRQAIIDASNRAIEKITTVNKLILQCDNFMDMEYDLLYDQGRNLMIIGYNVTEHRRDNSYYDLLASEARLCSFIAIARGELPQKHWFALGRLLTTVGGQRALLSWGGSMFEYLMPLLVIPTYENTLLDQTYKAVVKRQIDYGKQRGVPWGISESCFNMTDVQLNYQYRAFGVPGLGFRRELADDLVIAPYASVMSLMVAPEKACANLQRMTAEGFQGRYGFYEAIDYTPSRLTHEQANAIIHSFMTHHQGMSFLSLAYLLLNQPMQKRMKSNPLFQATELLLQERIPKTAMIHPRLTEASQLTRVNEERAVPFRIFKTTDTPIPEVHILSNGRYHVMLTNTGGGYSRWKGLALTRWREDTTRDNWGMFCYIRDVTSGEVWSTAYQPTLKISNNYEAIFTQGRAEFRRRDHNLDTHTEITVSPEDDIELRRINILNRSNSKRTIELTTYAEIVMSSAGADETHAAFNNLFVQTQIIREHHSILCTRRPRSKSDPVYWMSHMMTVHGKTIGATSYETDRSKFIGRSRNTTNPVVMDNSFKLSNSEGSVLDPIVAIRRRITIEPEETVVVDIVSGIAGTREGVIKLMEKYKDRHMNDRVFAMAWTHGQVILSQIKATENDAQIYGRLASSIIYANSLRRTNTSILMTNRRGQSGLWGYGISGDLPVVLLKIGNKAKIELVHQLVQAHAYWRIKGLSVDLVIWNEDYSSYRQALQEQILSLIATSTEAQLLNRPGGIFVKQADQIPPEDKVLMQSVARIIVTDSDDKLSEYMERRSQARSNIAQLIPKRSFRSEPRAIVQKPHRDLMFFNGFGGFTHDGREYVIIIMPNQATPAPWLNVLANQSFGTIISESGGSYTWGENAHQFRLTPWYNDPVCDTSGEALYIRDEDSGKFWSPTPLPAAGLTPYITRHGFGYSVFEHNENGIISELWVYVAVDAAVKFLVLKIRNKSGRSRRISVTGYFELVLGELRHKESMHVISEIDPDSGVLFAQNFYNTDFAGRVVFLDVNAPVHNVTADRNEFLGRNGTPANPEAMKKAGLSGRVGAALDPCAAMQVPFEIADDEEKEIVFTLGIGHNIEDARSLVSRFRGSEPARYALEAVWEYWKRTLGVIYLETPEPSINMLANGWLLYQTLASRIWARSGYYQSGGAFGFRDQLQDVMALLYTEPAIVRQHLLTCSAHQFTEGDVQHWWHPPSGKGVRTRCSDDYLWLPFATYRYVTGTGDTGILDERINFITDHPVNPNEDAYYGIPMRSEESATLYEHCVRAIKHGLRLGQHGLPLIGSGDWNDSFNLVGAQGKGESVWLGFFLHMVLMQFSEIAQKRGDTVFAEYCTGEAARLSRNIEQNAWDGEWYRRAYFDNGQPLGSATNTECRIDSLPQSWSVLSGAGDPKRAQMAMEAVNKYLVHRDKSLIQLFDPPFDKSDSEPGYVKGYIPGTRENGGQYTHAAIWTIMAFAALGNNQRAWELLSLINPINHGDTPEKIGLYKVEPYVIAADVYSVQPHIGRGGWTWYTGAAGWMYRLIVESILGLRLEVNKLRFNPCLPAEWTSFKMHYRHYETLYHITISQNGNGRNVTKVILDGIEQEDMMITLNDDRQNHLAEVEID
ncbi:MAG: glucoamylase family protein [Planctomycetota bacterium]